MGTRLSIPVPRDYDLKRDACSYGYFLLAPNHWDPRTRTLSRVLSLADGPATVRIAQEPARRGTPITLVADRGLSRPERAVAIAQATRMLRLDEDQATIRAFHRVDPRWKRSGQGRLFRSPTLFEDVVKTVTSCNVAWPSTIIMNRRLCEVNGPGGAFPSPAKLARTRIGTLRARCSVGYRDKRIVELAHLFAIGPNRGGLDAQWLEDPATTDDALHAVLLELPGVGPYGAANIMQLLGRYARLPLDTESLRHGRAILGYKGTDPQVMKALHAHYAPFGDQAFRSYWFEMWDFYESQRGPAWTWDRETTGKTFTASKLAKPGR